MTTLCLPVSEKKNFEVCLFCSNVQNCDPGAGQVLTPGTSYVNLIEFHKEMLHAKYQSSTYSSFREKKMKISFFVPLFKLVTPGTGPILTPGASYEHTS